MQDWTGSILLLESHFVCADRLNNRLASITAALGFNSAVCPLTEQLATEALYTINMKTFRGEREKKGRQ